MLLTRESGVEVQCPEVTGSEEKVHGHRQVSMLDAEDHWRAVLLTDQPGEGVRYPKVAGSVEKVHGHHQVSVLEAAGWQCCWRHCGSWASCWLCMLEVLLLAPGG